MGAAGRQVEHIARGQDFVALGFEFLQDGEIEIG